MSALVPSSGPYPERLYLSKGKDGDIYVNNCQILHKTQIDGLRAVFKIFKKKNPGVILNDAANSGKTVLAALFVESVQSILDNPVLILCNHDTEIEYWKEILLKWTKYTEDNIAVNATNPYLKKYIFIQSMDLSNSFFRRRWSVLIFKNDEVTKEVSKMVFDSEFKIWITTVDVFKDLNMLSSVSKFINTNINIKTADYEIKSKNVIEKIKTLTLLEAVTKDFVVRTDHLKSIVQSANDANKITNSVTKKNKDATGTKIKKSKRKCDEEPSTSNKRTSTKQSKLDNLVNAIEQDSPSLISKTSNNVTTENESLLNIHNDDLKPLKTYDDNLRNNESVINNSENKILETDVTMKDYDSTPDVSDNENEENYVSQINMANIGDEVNSPKLDIQNDIIKNINPDSCNVTNEAENEIKSDEQVVDINTNSSHIELNYSEDNHIDEVNKIDTKTETVIETNNSNGIDVDEVVDNKSKDVVLTNNSIGNTSTIPNAQATESGKDTIDDKINELEMKTLMKFKGSFLDSLF